MTGREKMQAAFSEAGSTEMPVVICYEDVFIRDHWSDLTSDPWYYQFDPVLERQLSWHRQIVQELPQDWLLLPVFYSHEERDRLEIRVRPEGVYRFDRTTGQEEQLEQPSWSSEFNASLHPQEVPCTAAEVDLRIAKLREKAWAGNDNGIADLARCLRLENQNRLPMFRIDGPLWRCYQLWGFEDLMMAVVEKPDLVIHACRGFEELCLRDIELGIHLGAELIWIEDCFTDMLGPEAYGRINLPSLARVVSAVRQRGMKSLYYFGGNPAGKVPLIEAVGADALSFEESKKDFTVDVAEMAASSGKRTSPPKAAWRTALSLET